MSGEDIPNIQQLESNTSQRTPCVLVLDGSGSMGGQPITDLNDALPFLEKDLKRDDVARMRVQLLIIRAGGDAPEILTEWTDAIAFNAPKLEADGGTPLGQAVELALSRIESQKEHYNELGIPYTRPWIFLISDGEPTDEGWESCAARCQSAEENKKVAVFAIGTESANLEQLGKFSTRGARGLKGLQFRDLFEWLSRSATAASRTSSGQTHQMAAADAWLNTEV